MFKDTLFSWTARAVAGVGRICEGTARETLTRVGLPWRSLRDQSHTLIKGFTPASSSCIIIHTYLLL